jgi:dephospho-CoA kinase
MVIGIAGTHGAGKGAVVQLLKEQGFIHCSARDLFLEELRKRGVAEPDRPAISAVANELRQAHGVDFVPNTFMERYDCATHDVIIESIYTMGEVNAIRNAGGYILAVDADPEIRYERIKHRMSETDRITKEDFLKQQEIEARSDDPTKQNARTVMENADYQIENNGDLEELRVEVNYVLEKIRKEEVC